MQNFYFKKLSLILKKPEIIDQKPLEKESFWLKSMNNAYIITNHDKVIANYAKVLQIATAITNFHKIITNYSVLQITTKQTFQLQTWQIH